MNDAVHKAEQSYCNIKTLQTTVNRDCTSIHNFKLRKHEHKNKLRSNLFVYVKSLSTDSMFFTDWNS